MSEGCSSRPQSQSFGSFLPSVLLVTSVFFCNFMTRLILPPLLVSLEREFGFSHGQAGTILLIMSVGISASLLVSGFISSWLTHRRTIVLSSLGVGISMMLISRADSMLGLQVWFVVLGLAVGLYLPSGVSTITSILPNRHWGKGLAVHEMAPNMSFILAPALVAGVEGILTWREVFGLLGTVSLGMGLIFGIWGQGGRFAGQVPSPRVVQDILRRPQFWLLALLFGLAVGITFGVYSMLPLYLVKVHDLTPAWANNLLSLSRVPCLAMAFGCGFMVDKVGPKYTILGALTASGVITVLTGLLSGVSLQIAVLAQPLFAVCFFPAAFASISSIFDFRIRNVAISFIVPVAVVSGTGFVPSVLGWFGDAGHFSLGFVFLGAAGAVGAFAVCFLKISGANKVP
ncbi:MAG: MFS transporter [Desulfovermiculus sp.]